MASFISDLAPLQYHSSLSQVQLWTQWKVLKLYQHPQTHWLNLTVWGVKLECGDNTYLHNSKLMRRCLKIDRNYYRQSEISIQMKGMMIYFLGDIMYAAILWLWLDKWEEERDIYSLFFLNMLFSGVLFDINEMSIWFPLWNYFPISIFLLKQLLLSMFAQNAFYVETFFFFFACPLNSSVLPIKYVLG